MPPDHPYRTPPSADAHVLHVEVRVWFAAEYAVLAQGAVEAQDAAAEIGRRAARILDAAGFPLVAHWAAHDQARATATVDCKLDGREINVFPADDLCTECGGRVVNRPVDDPDAGTPISFGRNRKVAHNRCRKPLSPEDRTAIMEATSDDAFRIDNAQVRIILRRYEETITALERRLGER